MLPGVIQRSCIVIHYKRMSAWPDFLVWKLRGSPRPKVPHLVKQRTVREYARRFNLPVLIETGTQFGQMVSAMKNHFRAIFSIELDEANYGLAVSNFARYKHIHILRGDSAEQLPILLQSIAEPCLFWLDGHSDKTPILDELRAVFAHNSYEHVILIDDAHCFGSSRHYPTLETVRALTAELRPAAIVESRDNMIRIHLPAPQNYAFAG